MPTTIVLREPRPWTHPITDALAACFRQRKWTVQVVDGMPPRDGDIVAGYGWGAPMQAAYANCPERVLHVDLAFWSRHSYYKLALGGRWSPLKDADYDDARLNIHGVKIAPNRKPGNRVLVCGQSAKAAKDWGYKPEEWERAAVRTLLDSGAHVIYRPKPTWADARPIEGAEFDTGRRSMDAALAAADAIATHHSNCAVDALAAGLPIYTDIGLAKPLSVARLEDLPSAAAPDIEARARFLRQVAWHQWRLDEIAEGAWLKPPAPLSGNPMLRTI